MHLSLRDVVTLDVLLEHVQNSAIKVGESTDARRLRTVREHLPIDGDALDEMLVMHIQAILTPLLLDGNPVELPDTMMARIEELIAALDRGRSRM